MTEVVESYLQTISYGQSQWYILMMILWRHNDVMAWAHSPRYCEVNLWGLRWRHNGRDSVSNHQPLDYLFKRSFRRRSRETSKLRVTGLCAGNSPGTGEFPHKWPATRKMFPSDDVIMGIPSNTSTNVEFWCVVNFNKLLNNSRQWFHTPWLSRDVSVMGRRLTCFHGVKSFSARQVLIGMTTFHPKASKCDWVSFLASIVR